MNKYNYKMELQKRATEIYNQLSIEDRKAYVNKRKRYLTIRMFGVGIPLLLASIGYIVICALFETDAFTHFVTIMLALSTVIVFIINILALKKPHKDFAIHEIKNEISEKVYKEVRKQFENGEIQTIKFKSDKIVEFISVGGRMDNIGLTIAPQRLLINSTKKTFVYQNQGKHSNEYKFEDILCYEVYENGEKKLGSTAGRTLIGWGFFGLGGALVGANTSRKITEYCYKLQLLIKVNDIDNPLISIDLVINRKIDKSQNKYKKIKESLQKACAMLEYMMNNRDVQACSPALPLKEKLQEIKDLMDMGLITQEEFELKKKELLSLY